MSNQYRKLKKTKCPNLLNYQMKPKIKRSHYRKNINQVYYLLKLKPSCNKIQKCAQIILLHDEFYTLDISCLVSFYYGIISIVCNAPKILIIIGRISFYYGVVYYM